MYVCAMCKQTGGTMRKAGTTPEGLTVYIHDPKANSEETRECLAMLRRRWEEDVQSQESGLPTADPSSSPTPSPYGVS